MMILPGHCGRSADYLRMLVSEFYLLQSNLQYRIECIVASLVACPHDGARWLSSSVWDIH